MLTRSALPIALLTLLTLAGKAAAQEQHSQQEQQRRQDQDPMMWLEAMYWAGMRQPDNTDAEVGGGGGERRWGGGQSAEDNTGQPEGGEHSGGKHGRKKGDGEQSGGSGRPSGGGGSSGSGGKIKRPEGMGQIYTLRAGLFPDRSSAPEYLTNAALWVSTPEGATNRVEAQPMGKRGQAFSVSGTMWGHYRILAYVDGGVQNGVRRHLLSQSSFMSHGDKVRPKAIPDPEGPGLHNGKPVLNIEQLFHHHGEMHRTYSGDTLHIRVTFQDKPLVNKEVALVTEKNWRLAKRTNDAGEADLLLIKEDFSRTGPRARPDKYMIIVEHTEAVSGEANSQPYTSEHYVTTFPMLVFPSRLEWESRSTAYLVVMTTAIVSGGAIAIRRRRRRRKAK